MITAARAAVVSDHRSTACSAAHVTIRRSVAADLRWLPPGHSSPCGCSWQAQPPASLRAWWDWQSSGSLSIFHFQYNTSMSSHRVQEVKMKHLHLLRVCACVSPDVGGPADPIAPTIIIAPRNTSVVSGTSEVTMECVANARWTSCLTLTMWSGSVGHVSPEPDHVVGCLGL